MSSSRLSKKHISSSSSTKIIQTPSTQADDLEIDQALRFGEMVGLEEDEVKMRSNSDQSEEEDEAPEVVSTSVSRQKVMEKEKTRKAFQAA